MPAPPPGKVAQAMQALRDENAALRDLLAAIAETAALPQPRDDKGIGYRMAARHMAVTIGSGCELAAAGDNSTARRMAAYFRRQHAESAACYEHAPATPRCPAVADNSRAACALDAGHGGRHESATTPVYTWESEAPAGQAAADDEVAAQACGDDEVAAQACGECGQPLIDHVVDAGGGYDSCPATPQHGEAGAAR